MRKLIVTLIMFAALLIVSAGCNEEICQPTAWLMGGTNADAADNIVTGRVGIRNKDGVEFGGETNYLGVHGANQSYGAYALTELTADPNTGIIPYIGFRASVVDVEDGSLFGPMTGTIIKLGGMESVLEIRYNEFDGRLEDLQADENNKWEASAGLRIKF